MDYTRRLQRLRARGWQKVLLLFYLLHAFTRNLLRIINFITHYLCKVVWELYTFTYDYNIAFHRVTWSLSQKISTVLLSSSNERIKASIHPAPLRWLQNALLLSHSLLHPHTLNHLTSDTLVITSDTFKLIEWVCYCFRHLSEYQHFSLL